ncbi:hypothetical protein EUGRSUZ_K02594 [Eucalyptus grandis]|uniref:Uncharacterized protein n=2 Tax=Eucalyptus grandis TaxID=71139 RepID=A0ACC3IWG7_EUCGR|nr:hypothetical protein EUGRSUZ_K02594 [Eucalyptus grandis]
MIYIVWIGQNGVVTTFQEYVSVNGPSIKDMHTHHNLIKTRYLLEKTNQQQQINPREGDRDKSRQEIYTPFSFERG